MKLALTLLLATALAVSAGQTVRVMLAWDFPNVRGVIGYRVYYGPWPGEYLASFDVMTTQADGSLNRCKAVFPWDGTNAIYVAVVAIYQGGIEGPPSNEIQIK